MLSSKRDRAAPRPLAPDVRPEVQEAARHIARVLRRERLGTFGLCPADDDVAVLPAAVQIGVALAEQSGAPVALVEVNARWSVLPPSEFAPTTDGDPLLVTRWLAGDRLALLTLPENASIGAGLVELSRLLRSGRSMFDQLLVDLTGLERLGEHLAAAAMCDALVFFARADRTSELQLQDLYHAYAGHRVLGVILTGSHSS